MTPADCTEMTDRDDSDLPETISFRETYPVNGTDSEKAKWNRAEARYNENICALLDARREGLKELATGEMRCENCGEPGAREIEDDCDDEGIGKVTISLCQRCRGYK